MHLHIWPEIRQCTFKLSSMYELFLHYQCSTVKVAFWWPKIVKWLSDIIYRSPWKKHVWCNFTWRVMVLTTLIAGTSFSCVMHKVVPSVVPSLSSLQILCKSRFLWNWCIFLPSFSSFLCIKIMDLRQQKEPLNFSKHCLPSTSL